MEEFKTINITKPNGEEVTASVITILKNPTNERSFLLYTFDPNAENVDIYASLIKEDNDNFTLDTITDKEDWDLIQQAIKELSEEE